jgi:hypothetical protein
MALISWRRSSRLGASQNVAYNAAGGASAASTVFGAQTYQVRVVAISGVAAAIGDAVRIVVGDGTPTATATSTVLSVNQAEYLTCTPGQKVAVLSNNASTGTLNVTEIA